MSLSVTAGVAFSAYLEDAPTGLEGTLGVQVTDTAGLVVIARTTALVELPTPGIYRWRCPAAPAEPGGYLVQWDTGADPPEYALEELWVRAPAAPDGPPDDAALVPDATFGEAQDRKRARLGSDVTFLGPIEAVWPDATPINPDSGQPFDPTIKPVTSERERTVIRCGVFFRAMTRGGSGEVTSGAGGWEERTRIVAIAPYSARTVVEAATELQFHGQDFKIDITKVDEIVGGYRRMLIYAAAK